MSIDVFLQPLRHAVVVTATTDKVGGDFHFIKSIDHGYADSYIVRLVSAIFLNVSIISPVASSGDS